MTFEYTDKQLNYLNREEYVYSVNKTLAESKNRKIVTDKKDEKLASNEVNVVTTPDNKDFKVVATLDDPATGFQGMAVAPIVNGRVDTNSVAVVAAGTTPTDFNDLIFVLRKK